MEIKDGRIIVTPSVALIKKLYEDGFGEDEFQKAFGFRNCMEYGELIRRNSTENEYRRIKRMRYRNRHRIVRELWRSMRQNREEREESPID